MGQGKNMTSNTSSTTREEVGTRRVQDDPLAKPPRNVCFFLLQPPDNKSVALYSRDETHRSDTYGLNKNIKLLNFTQDYETDKEGSVVRGSQSSPRYLLDVTKHIGGTYRFNYNGSANVPDSILRGEKEIGWNTYTFDVNFLNIPDYSHLGAKPLATSIDEAMRELNRSTKLNWESDAIYQLAYSLRKHSEGLGINRDLSEGLLDIISSFQKGVVPFEDGGNILSIFLRVIKSTYLKK